MPYRIRAQTETKMGSVHIFANHSPTVENWDLLKNFTFKYITVTNGKLWNQDEVQDLINTLKHLKETLEPK